MIIICLGVASVTVLSQQSGPASNPVIGGLLSLPVGALLLLQARRYWKRMAHLRRDGIPATGTVLRILKGNRGIVHPVIEFHDAHGRRIEFIPDVGYRTTRPTGSRVDVIYSESRPHVAQINTASRMFAAPLIFAVSGLAFCCGGAVMLFSP